MDGDLDGAVGVLRKERKKEGRFDIISLLEEDMVGLLYARMMIDWLDKFGRGFSVRSS